MSGLIGGDLEYALKAPDGTYIPAGVLPTRGTKGAPERFLTGGVEIDCCAIELTFDPAPTEDAFVSNILEHLNAVKSRYAMYGTLHTIPSIKFNKKVLKSIRHANEMGCEPDFCVWTNSINPRPKSNNGLRTFGGHVHIENATRDTVKACDLTLGLWSVVHDSDSDRRKMYGRAGAFRPKSYGMEYRVLSNFWCDSERKIRRVYQLVQKAKEIQKDIDPLVKAVGGAERIQNIINESQLFEAKSILKSLGIDYET